MFFKSDLIGDFPPGIVDYSITRQYQTLLQLKQAKTSKIKKLIHRKMYVYNAEEEYFVRLEINIFYTII